MHWHHKHDIDGCTDDHADQPAIATLLATLDRMEHNIMSANQDALNAVIARIEAAEVRIEAKLNEAPAPAPAEALDLTAANAVADKLDALVPAAPAAPAEPAPAPVVEPQAGDGAIPAAPADAPSGIPSVPLA